MKQHVIVIIIMMMLVNVAVGQDNCSWWEVKPNTRNDTNIIIERNIKKIKSYNYINDSVDGNDLYFNYELKIYKSKYAIDSTNIKGLRFCNEVIKRDIKNDRIIEIKEVSQGKNKAKYKLIHSLDSVGNIIKTELKFIKGHMTEDLGFERIEYKYENGLLTESVFYNPSLFISGDGRLFSVKYYFE